MNRTMRADGAIPLVLALAAGLLLTLVLPAAADAYTRAEKRDRANYILNTLTLSQFINLANSTKSGIDTKLNWSNDGCSAPADWATQYYQDKFNRSCRRHDFGYRNFGKNFYSWDLALTSTESKKKAIDAKFLNDMRSQCASWDAACQDAAEAFYLAVSQSGQGWTAFYAGECHPGLLCVFDDAGYKDRRKMLSSSVYNFNDIDFGDKTSSVKNNDNVAWRLYDDHGYSDRSICVPAGATRYNLDDYSFGDKTSSAKPLSTSYCP